MKQEIENPRLKAGDGGTDHPPLACFEDVLREVMALMQGILSQMAHPPITAQTSLCGELGFDSMTTVLLFLELEDHFAIEVDWDFGSDTPTEIARSIWKAMHAAVLEPFPGAAEGCEAQNTVPCIH